MVTAFGFLVAAAAGVCGWLSVSFQKIYRATRLKQCFFLGASLGLVAAAAWVFTIFIFDRITNSNRVTASSLLPIQIPLFGIAALFFFIAEYYALFREYTDGDCLRRKMHTTYWLTGKTPAGLVLTHNPSAISRGLGVFVGVIAIALTPALVSMDDFTAIATRDNIPATLILAAPIALWGLITVILALIFGAQRKDEEEMPIDI